MRRATKGEAVPLGIRMSRWGWLCPLFAISLVAAVFTLCKQRR